MDEQGIGEIYLMTKFCTKCKVEYPLELFAKDKSGTQPWCKNCQAEYRKVNKAAIEEYRKLYAADPNNVSKFREANLRKSYGLTLEEYTRMYDAQQGRCAICNVPEELTKSVNKTKQKRLHVDHCHKTGKVRGLLCTCCNNVLGRANDDINILLQAIEYLKFYSEETNEYRQNT